MSSFQIYHEEEDKNYTITLNLSNSVIFGDNSGGAEKSPKNKYYLTISTNMKKYDGSSFGTFLVEDLNDVAPGASAASTFTELIDGYVEYFLIEGEYGQSSSSSSSEGQSSSSSSSSSSESA